MELEAETHGFLKLSKVTGKLEEFLRSNRREFENIDLDSFFSPECVFYF